MGKPRLDGKVALITGAAGGIGGASARLFIAEGARVAATDLDETKLAGLAEAGALVMRQDVTEEARWREVVDATVAKFGRLDILVNNAGVAIGGNIEKATLADFRKIQAINVESVFLGCREAVRVMKAEGGSIVNVASVAGIVGDANSAAYCASKGAVRLLTKSVALYCARAGYPIRCNSLHPAFTDTAMISDLIATARDPERLRAGLQSAIPIGRFGKADEIAAAALYLASDEAAFTTGAELVLDGGLSAG